MPLEIDLQLHIVLYSLLAGLIVGGLFDLYRIIRGKFGPKIVIIIQDILFWVLCSIVIFVFLLYTNYGFFMPYVYLFITISLGLYLKVFSPFILKLELFLIAWFKITLRVSFKHIFYPVRLVFGKFKNKV